MAEERIWGMGERGQEVGGDGIGELGEIVVGRSSKGRGESQEQVQPRVGAGEVRGATVRKRGEGRRQRAGQ